MKKKGFTLIELLAVIVILAIIALILTPKISEIIMSARKAAFKETINGVLTSAQNYVTESILETENKDVTYPITFECDGTSCKNDKGDDLNFRGEVPISGEITILGTGVYADEVCNKYFCGSGYIHSISIVENDGNVPTNGIFEYNGTNGSDGSVQTYVVTKSGNYLLEAWGAQGGDSGGLGGYASGILKLKVNDILAVVVGGQGVTTGAGGNVGGYNGGGTGAYYGAGGGGATHIAIYNESYNTLTSYGDVDTATGLVYIIAGGGGGGSNRGGAGGGLVGQNGYGTDQWGNPNYSDFGYGGTQTAGGSNYSYNCGGSNVGAFGQGGSTCRDSWSSGGGGGYYGGGAAMSGIDGGGGGSGYVNSGINNWQLKTGVREGHGLAKITYIGNKGIAPGTTYTYQYLPTEEGDRSSGTTYSYKSPTAGKYKLEVWGASGANCSSATGGYGAYATGEITLNASDTLFITVGASGSGECYHRLEVGGFNGGGQGYADSDGNTRQGSGGGATHIAINNNLGELKNYTDNKDSIVIVAGGGAGASGNTYRRYISGGSGGGFKGVDGEYADWGYGEGPWLGEGGSSTNNSPFGYGETSFAGAGGGYYGGKAHAYSAGGGSSYIGYAGLSNKSMYCYNCEEKQDDANLFTISTTTGTLKDSANCPDGVSSNPISNCAKIGDGFAKITFIGN